MTRRSRGNVASSLLSLMKNLFQGSKASQSAARAGRRRGFAFEALEGRAMLATDFGAITGIIYRDAMGDEGGSEVSVDDPFDLAFRFSGNLIKHLDGFRRLRGRCDRVSTLLQTRDHAGGAIMLIK